MSIFVTIGSRMYCRDIPNQTNVAGLLSSLRLADDPHLSKPEPTLVAQRCSFFILCNGRKVSHHCLLENGKNYHIVPKVLGGKGGFGSMLRAIGAQIEKTTSREACRDLSGRRMRDINNEKKLKEWLAKEAERERERDERRQERLARRLGQSQHKFDDKQYHEQHNKAQDDLQDALQKGLKRVKGSDNLESTSSGPSKKAKLVSSKELLGLDIDSDDLQSDSDFEADPGCCGESGSAPGDAAPSSSVKSTETDSVPAASGEDPAQVKEECMNENGHGSENDNTGTQSNNKNDVEAQNVGKSESAVKDEVIDSNEPVQLEDYNSSAELTALGLERLKNALVVRGLKCGGTLEERAERLFSVKGLSPDQINPALFAKCKGKGKKSK